MTGHEKGRRGDDLRTTSRPFGTSVGPCFDPDRLRLAFTSLHRGLALLLLPKCWLLVRSIRRTNTRMRSSWMAVKLRACLPGVPVPPHFCDHHDSIKDYVLEIPWLLWLPQCFHWVPHQTSRQTQSGSAAASKYQYYLLAAALVLIIGGTWLWMWRRGRQRQRRLLIAGSLSPPRHVLPSLRAQAVLI
ncbi:hypothetical protein DFH09DRAFT_1079865 [Mycena vulgaris]|nr:hypothetical protein DFH09DRAFT_1079865 [Mycena vulgaris]